MPLSTVLVALSAVAAAATMYTSPNDQASDKAVARDSSSEHGFYYCTKPNWGGDCNYTSVAQFEFFYLAGTQYFNNIGSAGADAWFEPAYGDCWIVKNTNCNPDLVLDPGWSIMHPGIADTAATGVNDAGCIYCTWEN